MPALTLQMIQRAINRHETVEAKEQRCARLRAGSEH